MQTINISQRESSQSNHKVPKRRRLAPSSDVVDDRPPHQLVHGAGGPGDRRGGVLTKNGRGRGSDGMGGGGLNFGRYPNKIGKRGAG